MSDYKDQVEESRDTREGEATTNQQVADAGVPGQIEYPENEVNAERAAAFAAGKEDSLYEDERDSGWQNPADNVRPGDERAPGDETGEETEPEGVGGNPYGTGSTSDQEKEQS